MDTPLSKLLTRIEAIPDDVQRRIDHAVNMFRPPRAVITDWGGYTRCLAAFYREVERSVLALRGPVPEWDEHQAWQCWRLMKGAYGPDAPQAAYEIVRTGTEGGLLKVLRTVADLLAKEFCRQMVTSVVTTYWQGRSTAELIEDGREYVRRYGHLMPGEMVEGSAVRVQAGLLRALIQHPEFIRRLRTSLRHGSA